VLVVDAAEDSEWVSWAEAARLTGLPVHRVEWWKRQGRIEHRTEDKMRPTLRRSSVEEFGRWYHGREDDRRARREAKLAARQAARTPPQPMGYVTTAEATATTGLSSKTVLRRAKPLGALRVGRSWWIPSNAADQIVRQLRAEKVNAEIDGNSWVSLRDAARIIGCDDSTVLRYVKQGAIERRSAPHNRPSLSRRSVERFASGWRAKRTHDS
jgi:hypothetical protein